MAKRFEGLFRAGFALLFLFLIGMTAWGQKQRGQLELTGLGRATLPVDGPWKFQTGDDLAWAQPGFDDSGWQPILVRQDWESQGHPGYTGFAWYRRELKLDATGEKAADWHLGLYLPNVDSAAEVFWNGVKVGSYGRVPPNPVWYGFAPHTPLTIDLGPARSGVLAIRVWKAPYVYLSFENEGGIVGMPRVGSLEAVQGRATAAVYRSMQRTQLNIAVAQVSAMVAAMALLIWLGNRKQRRQRMLLWLALAMAFPFEVYLVGVAGNQVSFRLAYALIGPTVAINDLAVWMLLISLLGLEDRLRLVRWTWVIGITALSLDLVDTVCQFFDWTSWPNHLFLHIDVGVTVPAVLMELWGIVLVLAALRKRLDLARWILAIAVFLSDLRQAVEDIGGLGERWTHWSFFEFMAAPLFKIGESPVTVSTIASTLLLISLLYAAWRYSAEQTERQNALLQEFLSAQALQQVLVPESLPVIPGYTVTSAYRPAQEVGGDFFQLIPLPGDAALLVIGDVSGKGLPAAMAVAMIVGAIRSTVEMTDDPAQLLGALNRRLHGRLRGGFATCLAMRMDAEGLCTIANAGHLPPFSNGREVGILPSLPLGLAPAMEYECSELQMGSGDQLTLYTDGLLEARNADGELFGFARIAGVAAESAEAIAQAAQVFGQNDDITVLTVKFAGLEGMLA
jgi:hypothetical protein